MARKPVHATQGWRRHGDAGIHQIEASILPITMPSPVLLGATGRAPAHQCAHLCRGALAATGLTPIQYQQAVRIDRSKDLLETSRLPIEDVAERVGYGTVWHLAAYLKR